MLPNSFLLISFRKILQDFLAFFRFTEADAIALLSAYGGYALEADRLQDNRLIVQKKTSGSFECDSAAGGGRARRGSQRSRAFAPISTRQFRSTRTRVGSAAGRVGFDLCLSAYRVAAIRRDRRTWVHTVREEFAT